MKNQLTSFVKQIIAVLNGDNAEATAQKIFRKADSAFRTQLASLDGVTILLEEKLETCKENLQIALTNNGKSELDSNSYIKNILNAQNKIIEAEEELENHLKTIAFLKEQYEKIQN